MSVVLLFGRAPSQRDVSRFGLDVLARSFETSIYDVSPLLRGPLEQVSEDRGAEAVAVEKLKNFSEIVDRLSGRRPNLIIDALPPGSLRERLRIACRRQAISVVVHPIGPLPPLPDQPFRTRLAERFPKSPSQALRTIRLLRDSMIRSRGPSPDVFISAGDSSLRRTDALSAARIIHGRSFDCDEYERSRELSDLPAAFDVFVDSGGPLHPDYDYLGFRRSALPNDYFSVLKNFLSAAEQTTGRPVLIARHPRMKNVPYQDFLPEFEIFDDVTASLIQKSTAVFDTGSTATSFSVLAHKQVFYLTPGALPGSAEWRLATGIARSLGREASTTTEQFVNDLRRAEEIPFHTFDSYRREYLFSDLSSRRSFAEEITSLLQEE